MPRAPPTATNVTAMIRAIDGIATDAGTAVETAIEIANGAIAAGNETGDRKTLMATKK